MKEAEEDEAKVEAGKRREETMIRWLTKMAAARPSHRPELHSYWLD